MFVRSLSVFFRKHTVYCGTRWLALGMMAAATIALLSGCGDSHH